MLDIGKQKEALREDENAVIEELKKFSAPPGEPDPNSQKSVPKKSTPILAQNADKYPVVADLGLALFELRVQKGRPVKISSAINKVLKDPKWKGRYSIGTLHAYASFAVRSGYFKEKYDIARVKTGVYGFTSDSTNQS